MIQILLQNLQIISKIYEAVVVENDIEDTVEYLNEILLNEVEVPNNENCEETG